LEFFALLCRLVKVSKTAVVMISEAVYLHYLNSLLEGDKKQCLLIVENLLEQKVCLKDIYLELFQRSMYRIGQMWENERCSIANEHIATKITESLIEITSAYSRGEKKLCKTVLITCIDKEFHELGARMVAGFFDALGWDTIFIGSNTPQPDIITLIREHKPDIFGISNNFYINIGRLAKLIDQVKSEFPEQEILVGGQALADGHCGCLSKFDNVHYIRSLDELEKYLAVVH